MLKTNKTTDILVGEKGFVLRRNGKLQNAYHKDVDSICDAFICGKHRMKEFKKMGICLSPDDKFSVHRVFLLLM